MQITDVKIRMVNAENSKLKAVASLIIDECLAIHDIKIIEGDNGEFIAMPSRKTPSGDFKDIAHPINSDTREVMRKAIIDAYHHALTENSEV
ncbi:MAG: septation regulator SpoVG [Bacteroides sp.]|nr:septation regulator SpoVG [Bacillota bacterium]MCM1394015.1 septation regulator SpoVG [[Eubacterium] siraeum]MCM1455770.1 septation regulator SpoVG [Bacteroides sp.]